jgi:hypothetical protein
MSRGLVASQLSYLTFTQNTSTIDFLTKKAKLIKVTARTMHSFRTLPLLHTMTPPAETNISSTATRCSVSSIVEAQTDQTYSKDFRYLPIPRRLRYDPDKPFYFGMPLNVSFAVGSTFGEP